jgi:hypothetical protein
MAKKKGSKKTKQLQQQEPTRESLSSPPIPEVEEPVQGHEWFTHTNTDKTCLDTSKPRPFRWFYQYKLWTGLYMLNPREQAGFNVFGFILSVCMVLYFYAFINGFRDGFARLPAEM